MKRIILLLILFIAFKASAQTPYNYTLPYNSVRGATDSPTSFFTVPGSLIIKPLTSTKLAVDGNGKVIRNDTPYVSQKTNLVQYPDSMSWRPPFQIYQQNGVFYTSSAASVIADKISTVKPYYMSPDGSDSNDGLSVATPVKTLSYARSTLNAQLIYLLPGKYKRDAFYGTVLTASNRDIFLIGIGKVYVTSADTGAPSWSSLGGGIYQTTLANVGTVVDNAYYDKYGFPFKLQKVNTTGGLTDTLSSYYVNGTDVRVHLTANRAPDSNVDLLLQASPGLEYRATAGYLYMENITFMGGSHVFYARPTPNLTSASSAVVLSKNCNFIYGGGNIPISDGTDTADGYNVTGLAFSFVEGGFSYKNQLDGYHYGTQNTATKFFEYNVNGLENGGNDKEQEKNGSSAHNNASGVRVNGKYGGGKGPSVIDVQTGETFIVGSEAIGTVADSVSANQDFVAGSKTGSTYRKMWILSGKSRSTARAFVGRLGFIKKDSLTCSMAPDSGNVSVGFLTGNLNAAPLVLPTPSTNYNATYPLTRQTNNTSLPIPITVGNSTAVTTGVTIEASSATGSATITPTVIGAKSTTDAPDWALNQQWARLDFISNDATGPGSGTRAAVGASFSNAGGRDTQLDFLVSNATSLYRSGYFDKDGRLNLLFTRTGTVSDAKLTIDGNGNVGKFIDRLAGSATLNFPSTAAQSSSELTITVTGAVEGDVVAVGVPNGSSNANSCFIARVSAADTVTVKFNNYSTGAIDPASGTFKVTVFK